jgi:hypothetical protein
MAEPFLVCPPHWRRSTLEPDQSSGFIVSVSSGATPSTTKEEYWDGDIPWLTPKDITGLDHSIWVSSSERYLTREGLANCPATLMPAGTVMLSKRAPVGAVAVNAVPMATNQGFLNFTCGPLLRPLFLAYWLRANRPYLDLVANGSMYPELYVSTLFEFEISVPAPEEQDKIISVIGALQFVNALGVAAEQAVAEPGRMLEIQEQSKRLAQIRDSMLPLIISGQLDVSRVASRLSDHFVLAHD